MAHRYGRHGKKAWLRWRQTRFRHTALTSVPQVAVLNVPLEFLRRIRKVTILMNDGTEESLEPANFFVTPSVDADKKNETRDIGALEQLQDPRERYFAATRTLANNRVEESFRSAVNPYRAELDKYDAKERAVDYYFICRMDALRLGPEQELAAQNAFVKKLQEEYEMRLDQVSAEYGVTTEGTRQLLIFARTDKTANGSNSPAYASDRAVARASLSLFSDRPLRQEEMSEKVLETLRERIVLYQKVYEEFEPAKEED